MVVTWLNRGTLHLVLADDYPWLQAITAPRHVKSNARRLDEEGVSAVQAERGTKVILDALADAGPLGRNELRERLDRAGVPTAGQALIHLIGRTALQGSIVRGPVADGQQLFVLVEDWLGPQADVDLDMALAELARRYLAGHGPAEDRDLAKWAGITLGQARAGLKAIGNELREVDGTVDLVGKRKRRALPGPRLLGPFDPVLHGWASRDFLIPAGRAREVVTVNGIFRASALVQGQVAGIWSSSKDGLDLDSFRPLDQADRDELDREHQRIQAFLAG